MMRWVERLGAKLPMAALFVVIVSGAAIAVAIRVFGITTAGSFALYFVTWWTLLFAALPFGLARRADEAEAPLVPGADPGAPATPRLGEKAVLTTLVATPVFLGAVWALPLVGL